MTTNPWLEILGRDSEDETLRAALERVGVQEVPPIEKDSTDVKVMLPDAMLIFGSGEIFPALVEGGDGSSVLSAVVLPLQNMDWGKYEGSLPYDLTRQDSQAGLRARFGEPLNSDEDFYWDEWQLGERVLRVEFTEDFREPVCVIVSIPEPE